MAIWNRDFLPSTRTPLEEMENIFDRFRRDFYSPDLLRGVEGFSPKIEVEETDKSIFVSAEIPGMKEKDINVSLRENNLIIEGEKIGQRKNEEKGLYRSEFSYGSFYRTIPLSAEVDTEKVEATYKNGVLEITLNKLEESKQSVKRIEIKH